MFHFSMVVDLIVNVLGSRVKMINIVNGQNNNTTLEVEQQS